MTLACVVFDFDGVIIDSVEFHRSAWRQALKSLWGRTLDDPNRLTGMAAPDIARLLAREAGHPSEAHRLAEAKAQALTEMGYHLPLFNGARELLEELRRRGVPYGLATNASRRFTDAVVAAQGLHFDAIVTLDEAPRPKPAPDVYQMCARMLGCSDASFRDVPVFEDSLFGLRGVAAAGMRPLGVESNHPGEELREAGAVLVFKDLAEALRQIDLWLKK